MSRHGTFRDTPLAVIGMACRLPGADDLQEYWRLLGARASAITELPADRLDRALYYHPDKGIVGKTYSTLGGLVPDRPFDRDACPIPDELLASADWVALAMLEVAAAACRHAGLDPFSLPRANTGVFVGHARGSPLAGDLAYARHIEETVAPLSEVSAFARLSPERRAGILERVVGEVRRQEPRRRHGRHPEVGANAVAGLVSDAFGLSGPCMAVDAACASSLYAVFLAAQALHRGQVEMAIVGGASYSNWHSLVLFSQAQALSAAGSFPFDARADGFISADGYGAILLKTLPRALADGDSVHGVIRGVGVSCDGRGKSLWAPRKEGQVEAIRRAYGDHLDPGRVEYIEAHGTSTQLGDATEVAALTEVFGDRLATGTKVPLCSVKANIGHTRETAGIAGLIKTLLCMRHEAIPGAVNFARPNPDIAWERIPFFVPTADIAWPARAEGPPRRAGIEAFGIGGLNVHVVVDDRAEESPRPASLFAARGPARAEIAPPPATEDEAVAIVGLGAILPGARTIAAYWDLLLGGRDARGPIPPERWNADLFLRAGSALADLVTTRVGGFITDFAYDWKTHRIPPRQLETADPLQFMLLDAAEQALRDAGYELGALDGRRAGVVVGTCFGGDFSRQLGTALRLPELQRTLAHALRESGLTEDAIRAIGEAFGAAFARHHPSLHDETGSYTSSTLASRIAKTFDLMGGAVAVDAGEASSLAALDAAVGLVASGRCDWVLCAGAQRNMDVCAYEGYAEKGVLARATAPDGAGPGVTGFVPGEGVGIVVLKRLSAARRDGDPIRAIIRAVGTGTRPRAPADALRLAIERTLSAAGVRGDDVAVVEASATGVPGLEAAETEALTHAYGSASGGRPLRLDSVVRQIGHTQGASGMASLLKLALAFQHGRIPTGSPSAESPDASPPPAGPGAGEVPRYAAVSAWALRGSAYHALLERPRPAPPTPGRGRGAWRIVRLGADGPAGLGAEIARAQAGAAAVFAAAPATRFAAHHTARLAVVADGADSLAQKLLLARRQLSNPGARVLLEEQGIFHGAPTGAPRVAFLFAGQGSAYPGMLRELIEQFPPAAAMRHHLDATLTRLGLPAFAEIAWNADASLDRDVWLAQVSVLLADLIVHAAVCAVGVRADVVSGHSYGEYPALVATGAWTLEQAIRVTRARCDAITATPQARGVMLSTDAPAATVEGLLAALPGGAYVANYNAPDQTVVGATEAAAAALRTRLLADGFDARPLPVPRPFHTPLMADVKEPLRRVVQRERLLPPRLPLLSSVTNRYVADPVEIRANLVDQLTAPVRYVDLVERLAADGVTVLVEIGPKQVLTRLHRRILGDRVSAVAGDHAKRGGIEQLCRVRAVLECAGAVCAEADDGGRRAPWPLASPPAGEPVPQPPILHFDATAARRSRVRGGPARKPESVAPAVRDGAAPADELASLIVTFVCEQTGYPPEIVDLDADLEADLGIDSIKKARLLGELRERCQIAAPPTATLSLDDFPTLRHILDFVRAGSRAPIAPAAPATAEETGALVGATTLVRVTDAAPAGATPAVRVTGAAPAADAPREPALPSVRLSGTHYEIGQQHAGSEGDRIKQILQRYRDLLPTEPEHIGALRDALARREAFFTAAGLEEMQGLADELKEPVEHLIGYNLGLYPPQLGGCAQFAIRAVANGAFGMIHGVNEDSPLSLSLPGCLTRLVQVRHPDGAVSHVIFSVSGQLGGLNGINAHGLAVTSTMLLDRRDRPAERAGRINPVLVKTVLETAQSLEQALELVRATPKTGAWSLCLSHHPTDRLCYVEYDGDAVEVQEVRDGIETTNHCVIHASTQAVPEHSRHRLNRLRGLLGGDGRHPYTVTQARAALRDRYDLARRRATPHPTMNTVRRVDNQMSLVMRPALGEAWVTPGPLATGRADHYDQVDLAGLLGGPPPTARRPGSARAPSTTRRDTHPEDGPERGVMTRHVLRMVERPLAGPAAPLHLAGAAVILGDNPAARALSARLRADGAAVWTLGAGAIDDTLARLDRCWEDGVAPHLFIMTGRDEDSATPHDEAAWRRRREQGLMLPYWVCQRWMRLVAGAHRTQQATLAAAVALGGDFGLSGRSAHVEGGAIAGLLKAVRHEVGGVRVKVLDLPADEAAQTVADTVYRELAGGTPEVEVSYVRGHRRVVRAVPRPAAPAPGVAIHPGANWVITGGARGITAIVARALGERFGLTLHLIGTTPVPDGTGGAAATEKTGAVRETLRDLARRGVPATYYACDVADRAALAAVLAQIRRSGPIRGIVHGAGVEEASRFERKRAPKVAATIAAKVDGAAALIALTHADPLDYFIAFGSIAGRFGGHGQTDYSLASDMLAKLVARLRAERPSCAAVTFHWPPWDAVGMAVRPETKLVLEMVQQVFLPPAEGVRHLLDELAAGAPEAEVLIVDRAARLDPDGTTAAVAERPAYRRRDAAVRAAPLIEGIHDLADDRRLVAEARFDPRRDRFLTEHRLGGIPLLPGAVAVELLAEAASVLRPARRITALSRVEILNGVRFFADRPQEVRVAVKAAGDALECELRADFHTRAGRLMEADRLYLRGVVELDGALPSRHGAPDDQPAEWHPMVYPDRALTVDTGRMSLGPAFRCVREVGFERSRAWARIVAPSLREAGAPRQAPGWIVPWTVLDGCFQLAGSLMYAAHRTIQLPHGLERLVLGRQAAAGEACVARLDWTGREGRHNVFDFTLAGANGDVILHAQGYRTIEVAPRTR